MTKTAKLEHLVDDRTAFTVNIKGTGKTGCLFSATGRTGKKFEITVEKNDMLSVLIHLLYVG